MSKSKSKSPSSPSSPSPHTIITTLTHHFPSDFFRIEHAEDTYSIWSVGSNVVETSGNVVEANQSPCLQLGVHHDTKEIMIKLVTNCSTGQDLSIGRGTDNIQRIIQVSKTLHYALKIEYDVSTFSVHGMSIWLRSLKLLTTGQTWYNALGFYEDDYETNGACIRAFLDQPFRGGVELANMKAWMGHKERLSKAHKSRVTRSMSTLSKQYKSSMVATRRRQAPLTVQQYFVRVSKILTTLAKKPSLTVEERGYVKYVAKQINSKMAMMEKQCPALRKKYYNLTYREHS